MKTLKSLILLGALISVSSFAQAQNVLSLRRANVCEAHFQAAVDTEGALYEEQSILANATSKTPRRDLKDAANEAARLDKKLKSLKDFLAKHCPPRS